MIKQWEIDREYLERKFTDPDFYNGVPGKSPAELKEELISLFEKTGHLPHPVAKAEAFALIVNEMQVSVSNCDYFPAFSIWGKKLLASTHQALWRNEIISEIYSGEDAAAHAAMAESRTVQVRFDYEHSVPDWDAVLELGFSGLLERACRYEKDKSPEFAAHPEYCDYFAAIKIEYQAILKLMERLTAEAAKLPAQPKGAALHEALLQLQKGSARNFYEALLQIWLYFLLSEYVDVIQTRTFGNLDRILYPYYKRDLDSGRYTEAEIRYFIRSFMYQATAMHYTVGHPFYFGGTNADGSSAINELSYLILDEYDKMGIFDPKLQIKVSENTPVDFIDRALDMIRRGQNSIVFVGEPCIIRTMLKYGYSLREAQTADIKGCYEYCARGGAVETAPVTVNAAKVLGLALHNGVEVLSGKRIGLETGEVSTFKNFRQLYRAFLRQLFFMFDRSVEFALRIEKHLDTVKPAPMLSATFEESLRRAVDGYSRGAKYNNSNVWLCAPATAADSLTMIKRYVFDRKELTLAEFTAILDRDFAGDEVFRQRLLHDPEKYGNNQELPDRIAVHFASAVARRYNGKPNSRGGFFTTALHASNRFVQWADQVEATADGRKRGDELSKNITATQGCSFKGATALVASALKFDSSLFMADLPVDVMLHPSEVKGDAGIAAMRSLLMTFIKHYGHALQFNVMDVNVLRKAQDEPEQYRDLQVRICGWNVLWNSIPRREQDAYIRQAERL